MSEISDIERAMRRDEDFVKATLKRYLANEKLANLCEPKNAAKKVFQPHPPAADHPHSLELSGKCQTDRLGVLAQKVRSGSRMAHPARNLVPCDQELSIPWSTCSRA